MKHQAFYEAVKAFCQRTPFQPFVIELEEGEPLVVRKPEQISGYAGLYFPPNGSLVLIDQENVLRVVELSQIPTT